MGRAVSTEFQKARRFVLRRLEEYLMESTTQPGMYEWVSEVEDGTDEVSDEVLRARLKAIQSVRHELTERGSEPGEKR